MADLLLAHMVEQLGQAFDQAVEVDMAMRIDKHE